MAKNSPADSASSTSLVTDVDFGRRERQVRRHNRPNSKVGTGKAGSGVIC